MKVRIHGIDEGEVISWKEVTLSLKLGKVLEIEHSFIVLEEQQLPYCFSFGVEFLRLNELIVDVGKGKIGKGSRFSIDLSGVSECIVNFF